MTRVSDGDSIVVTIDGTEQRVRLLGVDAPEHGRALAAGGVDAIITNRPAQARSALG